MTRDPYSHRAIRAIALPMMLSSVSVPLVGLVDTAVLGHLDDKVYLAAVAAAIQIFNVLFIGCNFLRMGTTGITAQAHGTLFAGPVRHAHRDNVAPGRLLGRSLRQPAMLALAIGALIILLQVPIRQLAFAIIGAGPEVTRLGQQYFDIRVWSAPATLLNYVAIGWLLGMQNGRGPLLITLAVNLGNVILDLWFVLGLGFKVRGVATAALLAELAGTAVALWLVRRELGLHADLRPALRAAVRSVRGPVDLASYRTLLTINGNLFLRTLALMFTFVFMTAQAARLGTVILAANGLLLNFLWLTSYALDGIANAAEALVGKAVGARDRIGMQHAVNRTLAWSLGFGIAFTTLFWLAGPVIVRLLTSLPEVRSAAFEYLPWLVALPMIAVWSFFYDGVYVGATLTREMRIVMTSAAFLVFIPVWYVTRSMGNHGLWLAFTTFMIVRGLAMHFWFNRLKEHLADGQTS